MDGSEPAKTSGPSRRNLLVAASGVTVGFVSSGQVAAGTSGASRQEVTVSRDEVLPSGGFDRAIEDADVPVSTTDRDVVDGIERFAAGETDIVHARRPLLPQETDPIDDERGDVGFESVAGTAFAIETGTWRSPLRDGERLAFREANPRAGTWAELADRSAPTTAEFEESAVEKPAQSDGEVIARGVRPTQYAEGHGGLGYYPLSSDGIVSGASVGEGSTPTPLVQLRYTYVNGESLDRSAVERYLDVFEADTGGPASLEPFPEPVERTGTVEPLP